MAEAELSPTSEIFVRFGAPGAKTFAPPCCARNAGQWKADSRKPRHRYSSRCSAFLSSRRLGAIAGSGVSGLFRLRRSGSNYSLEFSAVDAGVENRARACHRKYRGIETGG